MYNGERDMLDLRLHILSPVVDKFIVVEAKTTFSGNPKPLYFWAHQESFKPFWKKLNYFVVDENYSKAEILQAEQSPNTAGAAHWKREFLQKESIHKALIANEVKDDDIIFIGDADEIWNPMCAKTAKFSLALMPQGIIKLKLKVYVYWLNNASSEQFWGPIVTKYSTIKDRCLNEVRSDTSNRNNLELGWHFTSMGGLREVRRKLNDSYTAESYNTDDVQLKLVERMNDSKDYLGRTFHFKIDTKDWPDYLKANRQQYTHLLREIHAYEK